MRTLVLLLLLLPLASAITITNPTGDITATTLPTTVTASWTPEGTETLVTLSQGSTIIDTHTTTAGNRTYALGAGTYTILAQQNSTNASNASSAVKTFTISQKTLPTLTIVTNKNAYDAGETVHLTATSNTPISASLHITNNGNDVETYTLNIQSSVNLIYIPETPGTYDAILSAEGASASAAFTVQDVLPLTVDFTHTTPIVNTKTTFTSTVTGGKPPYTYQWLFSDNTQSQGPTADHFFFESGPHTATLVVTDAQQEQRSKTRSFTVEQPTYALEVTVRDDDSTLLNDITVTLTKGQDTQQKKTGTSGTVIFTGLHGNYSLRITQLNTTYHEQPVVMDRERNLLLTITYFPEETTEDPPEQAPAEPVPEEEPEPPEPEEPEPAAETMIAAPPEPSPEEQLQTQRQEAKTTLSERRFSLQLAQQKDNVLRTLELYRLFDEATQRLTNAKAGEIQKILADVPTDVLIHDEKTTITYPEPDDLEDAILEFLDARAVTDKELAKKYRHNIRAYAKNTSIKTTTTQATVRYGDRGESYTIVSREVTAPPGTYVIEVIPKTFAQDVSKMRIDGKHEVLKSDPVIRMNQHAYTYSTKQRTDTTGTAIVVPIDLQEPPFFSGLVTFSWTGGSVTRNLMYIILLGIFLVGIVAGTKISRKRADEEQLHGFIELAEQALHLFHVGQTETAATVTAELLDVYTTLPEAHQEQLADIAQHLTTHADKQRVMGTITDVYRTVSNGTTDVNVLSGLYEQILTLYERLSPEVQEELQPHMKQLDQYLDKLLGT